jgi:signal peptide peptidase SppA
MHQNILERLYNKPQLIRPEKLEAIRSLMVSRMSGIQADVGLLAELRAANEERRQGTVMASVAVVPVLGTLVKRGGLLEDSSGMTSTDALGKRLDALMSDESVGAVLLDVDSPGGETFGVQELADKIFAMRGRKPIVASVNPEMASAALWIGSAADSVSITPSGWIGSLGVYMAHTDLSGMKEAAGVKVTYISAGDFKVEGNADSPLTDDARAYYQGQVDAVYDQFLAAVAKFRGRSKAEVRENFGKGRMVQAREAKAAGMVDRIETFDETLSRLAGNRKAGARARADRFALEKSRAGP